MSHKASHEIAKICIGMILVTNLEMPENGGRVIGVIGNGMIGNLTHFAYHLK